MTTTNVLLEMLATLVNVFMVPKLFALLLTNAMMMVFAVLPLECVLQHITDDAILCVHYYDCCLCLLVVLVHLLDC